MAMRLHVKDVRTLNGSPFERESLTGKFSRSLFWQADVADYHRSGEHSCFTVTAFTGP